MKVDIDEVGIFFCFLFVCFLNFFKLNNMIKMYRITIDNGDFMNALKNLDYFSTNNSFEIKCRKIRGIIYKKKKLKQFFKIADTFLIVWTTLSGQRHRL